MAEDINDTIHVIVDHRVGICPFNVNKWDVTDTLSLHGAAEINYSYYSCASSLTFLEQSCSLIQAHNENCTFSARLQENLAIDFVKFSNTGKAFSIRCFTLIDVSKSKEYFLIISAKPELNLGQHLVNGHRNSAATSTLGILARGYRQGDWETDLAIAVKFDDECLKYNPEHRLCFPYVGGL
ncbi:unnamed protein product [Porites lobata]|uniref:Uncharacterized protein n=1 Tax=Porites lobata TaxID=104759 RepID=A0ABN8Q7W6_9CNID|nr:unnamed protein product [Porites lobata]